MKKFTSFIVLLALIPNIVFADCDFSKVVSNPDGTYTYSKELHICVGTMKQQNSNYVLAISDLKKSITLKDLALQQSDQRTQLWMDTSFKMEQREESIDSLRKKSDWLYFGLGALTIIGAGILAAQVSRVR